MHITYDLPVAIDDIIEAKQRLAGRIYKTGMPRSNYFSERCKGEIFLKFENMQRTGSFKIRGAFNKLSSLTDAEKRKGVVACSAGNHAQGVSLSCAMLGIDGKVVMPKGAPKSKVAATCDYSAEVVLHGDNFNDTIAKVSEIVEMEGRIFIPPYDDPKVIAGQGTIGLEIMEDLYDVDNVIVPIGGGGLIAGIAVAIKSINPTIRVIGVQSENVHGMAASFHSGEITTHRTTGEKVTVEVSNARMIPSGSDAISPAPHHDIYSIEDLRQLIWSLKEATQYKKPVAVKIAAVHNCSAIVSGVARAGADIIVMDGFRGGTGAAPTRIRDNVGIPIELALAAVDQRLRDESIRNSVSLVVSGSFRNSADVVKAIALGADAVYVATAPLIAMGCHMCQQCHTGKCNWGIATQRPELTKRLDPDEMTPRVVNLVNAWNHEIKEMLGGMGLNSIDSLRGNRLMLRGIGLYDKELEILGIRHAGE